MPNFDQLLAAIAGAPARHGARCKGRWHLWDETECPETVEYTRGQCRECPARQPCSEYFDSLKPSKRPVGVVAGQVLQPARPERPRKAVS